MFIDARRVPPNSVQEADICIIGAGAAGITIARELSGGRHSVALLESGGLEPDPETQSLYRGKLVGRDYAALEAPRVRYFGGTTNHWSGWCWPLDDIDFEARPWIPHSGWPFGKQELEPYYHRAQSVCQLGPYRYDMAFLESPQIQRLGLSAEVVDPRVLQLSPPTRFGEAYREDIEHAENVATYLYANVVDIESDANASKATRVKIASLTGNTFSLSARLFILATGGIENARLLLQSSSQLPQGLGNKHDLVGRFFADHVEYVESSVILSDPQYEPTLYTRHKDRVGIREMIDGGRMESYLQTDEQKQTILQWIDDGAPGSRYQTQIKPILDQSCVACHNPNGIGFFAPLMSYDDVLAATKPGAKSDAATPSRWASRGALKLTSDVQRKERLSNYRGVLDSGLWSDLTDGDSLLDSVANILGNMGELIPSTYRRFVSPEDRRTILRLRSAIEPVPNPDSRITLGEERDALGQRIVHMDWRLSEADKRTFQRSEELLGIELGRSGVGRLRNSLELEGSEWPDGLLPGWHHMGTTRMHSDPRQGVVDAKCKVHGMANLYVAGSSVFPTYGYVNPTLTIVALAIRLADHVKESLR